MQLKHWLCSLLMGCYIFGLQSCIDDLYEDNRLLYEDGLATSISLNICIPEMAIATRADMANGADSEVSSLWVGIFNAQTGKCTYANFFTSGFPTKEHQNGSDFVTINIDKTLSGPSFIVAVGNPEGNSGYLYVPSSSDPVPVSASPLTTLLPKTAANADRDGFTWATYQNLAISRRSLSNVIDVPMGNLPMSGVYYQSDTDPNQPANWETANYTYTYIPATTSRYTMPGAIHLRRLISQVKFNIKAADYSGGTGTNANKNGRRIISVVPESYRVVNAPATSWLHERETSVNKVNAEATNAGDIVMINSITYHQEESLPHKANYMTSATYSGNQYITGDATNGYAFDFWMLENKRRALTEGIKYDAREKEYKEDKPINENSTETYPANTGIYTALCTTDEEGMRQETMNNCATFVEIRCKIEYTTEGIGALQQDPNYSDVQRRTAFAVYTVHLGGIAKTKGQDDYDWSDFASRRNHKYTYNITVVDVDRIIVEANADQEDRPGIEGVVMDILEPAFVLDAHYGVFNICLSNKERTGGSGSDKYQNGFPFRIQVYDRNNRAIVIDQDNWQEYKDVASTPQNNNLAKPEYYWTWVEFRPTTGPDVLAEYKPYYEKDEEGNEIRDKRYEINGKPATFRLNEIADITKYPGNNGNTNADDETQQWYTVFVNEYTYEDFTDETANNWVKYANKLDRYCWLNTQGGLRDQDGKPSDGVSPDKESVHIRSKYFITQKSIQTFYDIKNIDPSDVNLDAIGMEHTNEVYGLNLRWAYHRINQSPWDYLWDVPNNDKVLTNGKWTQREYIRDLGEGTGSYKQRVENTNVVSWTRYVNPTVLQKITNINTNSLQYANLADHAGLVEGQVYYVPSVTTYEYYRTWGDDSWGRHNPNTRYAVAAMNACLNRNRDNNGNGKIDRSEIRWYLPSSGEMVDLVNGRNSLENPLMDYDSNPSLNTPPKLNGDYSAHHGNLRFHYATSNHRLLWAEEGITINHTTDDEAEWNKMGWQVRCARALGTDLRDDEMTLTPAFEVDNPNNPTMIYPTYFESRTLREPTDAPLEPHQETSFQNRISETGFEFSKTFVKERSGNNVSYKGTYKYSGNDANSKLLTNHDGDINEGNRQCATLNTTEKIGWRMPNIKECAVLKLALNNAGKNYEGNPGDDGVYSNGGYDIGNYYACTYREYGVGVGGNPDASKENRQTKTGYYLGILYENQSTNAQGNLGRAQCLTETQPTYYLRCVRDLEPGEFKK